MAFRTDIANQAAIAYETIRLQMIASKRYLLAHRQAFTNPLTDAFTALEVIPHFAKVLQIFDTNAAVPGVAVYAQQIVTDQPGYDVVAEYNAVRAAMVTARDQMMGMFPKDANGNLLYQQLDANGNLVNIQFTAAQLTPVVALLDDVTSRIAP